MEKFTGEQLAAWTKGKLTRDVVLSSVCTDSRAITPGCLFVPLKGENFDGHDYIGKAIDAGAAAVLSHRTQEAYRVPTVYVEDTGRALLPLAGGYRAQFSCPVVAVTGSVGKTTTKDIIASVLAERFCTIKTDKNLNNQIGLPLSVLRMDYTTEAAVFEMGMNHAGEISTMVPAALPTIAVITNVGLSHVENLGSREAICQAKLEIMEGLAARGGKAVLCGDEPLLYNEKDRFTFETVWYGIQNAECAIRAFAVETKGDTVSFVLRMPQWERQVTLAFPGVHNVSNALAATAVGDACGMSADEIVRGLEAARPEGRQMVYERQGCVIYEDCYNASPEAMEATLAAFAANGAVTGKRFAALGGMLELGSFAEEGHRRAGVAAAKTVDRLYLFGEGAAFIRAGALAAGMKERHIRLFESHADLAQALQDTVRPGDGILFKGSHGMHMERALKLFLREEV